MKTYKVYEIINSMGTVEHVGETHRSLESRMYEHTKVPLGSGSGRFYGRNDVSIHLVTTFDNRKDALLLEDQLKQQYGLRRDEYERNKNAALSSQEKQKENGTYSISKSAGGKKVGPIVQSVERTCPYCNKTIKGMSYFRWHGDNCKNKI
jgi:predicted GIY-YIG superfamily endonuclease